MPTSKGLQELLERIQLRLDESFVGIGSEVASTNVVISGRVSDLLYDREGNTRSLDRIYKIDFRINRIFLVNLEQIL